MVILQRQRISHQTSFYHEDNEADVSSCSSSSSSSVSSLSPYKEDPWMIRTEEEEKEEDVTQHESSLFQLPVYNEFHETNKDTSTPSQQKPRPQQTRRVNHSSRFNDDKGHYVASSESKDHRTCWLLGGGNKSSHVLPTFFPNKSIVVTLKRRRRRIITYYGVCRCLVLFVLWSGGFACRVDYQRARSHLRQLQMALLAHQDQLLRSHVSDHYDMDELEQQVQYLKDMQQGLRQHISHVPTFHDVIPSDMSLTELAELMNQHAPPSQYSHIYQDQL